MEASSSISTKDEILPYQFELTRLKCRRISLNRGINLQITLLLIIGLTINYLLPYGNCVPERVKLYLVSGKHFNDKKDNTKCQIYLLKYKKLFIVLRLNYCLFRPISGTRQHI